MGQQQSHNPSIVKQRSNDGEEPGSTELLTPGGATSILSAPCGEGHVSRTCLLSRVQCNFEELLMTIRAAVRSLWFLVCIALWLTAVECTQAGVRGNSYRVTSPAFALPYECYIFSEVGQGPQLANYVELDFGLYSVW